MSLTIYSIPLEIFLDYLLPIIDTHDLLSLASTDRFFAQLCADDTFWKRKLKDDMNYSIVDARNKGFKLLYRGIRRPHVYVWGTKSDGRLGIEDPDSVYDGPGVLRLGVPFPAELPMSHVRTVSIVAGGWSFATLDEDGRLHVWGKLDSEGFINTTGDLGDSAHCQRTPATLVLPVPITSISAGRRHLLCLDAKHQVWLFASWGRPARIVSSQIQDPTSRTSRVAQVEAGWNMIAVLTEAGHVLVEWPFDGEFHEQIVQHHDAMSRRGSRLSTGDGVLHCATWEIHKDFLELPPLPNNLPALDPPVAAYADGEEELRIVKIAAGEGFVVVLTNQGHVLKMDITHTESLDELRQNFKNGRKTWIYLPEFSECERVQASFKANGIEPPDALHITHISATFLTFTAYSTGSSSVVLLGNSDTLASTPPNIVPALQNRNIVSVVLGDYHFGALTENGTMLTWGQYSNGALGLGDPVILPAGSPGGYTEPADSAPQPIQNPGPSLISPGIFQAPLRPARMYDAPPDVLEPTLVNFDQIDGRNDKFVFAIAASGWHTAALVIDMDPSSASSDTPEASSGSGDDGGDHESNQNIEHHDNHYDSDDGPHMPGAYFPGPARSPGRVSVYPQPGRLHPRPFNPFGPVEPIAPRVTRGSDGVRRPIGGAGFAGRGVSGADISRGIRGVRLGYAARGAYAGRGIGRTLVEAQGDGNGRDEDAAQHLLGEHGGGGDISADARPSIEEIEQAQGDGLGAGSSISRGLNALRIGYPGRGAFRGRTLAGGFRGIPPRGRRGTPGTDEDPNAGSPTYELNPEQPQ